MPDYSLKVYSHHLTFLNSFPELQAWLNVNGYAVRHTHKDHGMQVIYTFWDNHTSESETTGTNDATDSIMVAYCTICKTIEVNRRCTLFCQSSEAEGIKELEDAFSKTDEESSPNFPEAGSDYPSWLPPEE